MRDGVRFFQLHPLDESSSPKFLNGLSSPRSAISVDSIGHANVITAFREDQSRCSANSRADPGNNHAPLWYSAWR
jgi:hypothetical protein